MSTIDVKLKMLLPHQRYVLDNSTRFTVVCGGRRSGKTASIEELVYGGHRGISVFNGHKLGVYGLSHDTMISLWNELLASGYGAINKKDSVHRRIEYYGGGELEFWSMNNIDSSRGRKYHRGVYDEAAINSNLSYSWEQVGRAHLLDYRGDAYFLSTPKGMDNYFYDLYMNGVNGVNGWSSFRFPTSVNKTISPEEIEDARLTLPNHVFRQEFLAEFVADDADMWLYSLDDSRHTTKLNGGGMDSVGYLRGYPVYVSVDFNSDPLECSVWQMGGVKGRGGSFIHCIGSESIMGGKVDELGYRLRGRYPGVNMYLCGDASGVQRDVGRHQTLYQIMAGAMGIHMRNVHLNKKNLGYLDSRLLCNVMLQNYPRLVIEDGEMYRQMRMSMVNKNGRPGELLKDRNRYKMDMFDSMRYFLQTYFLDFARSAYFRGVSSGILS